MVSPVVISEVISAVDRETVISLQSITCVNEVNKGNEVNEIDKVM